ncbi:SipW-dependent-type signal peptide-containing protein [Rhodococcus sp. KRD162]|uniref:SipW-dependent-type signal peptide-containing protein n=1 Tax=Rhodococcus sp. KRD162 TaxID=2729725 RepID=UPI001F498892|nr:SipW-dependent-type signal peptide-containing protein [Rhodococcus sp. KRD162]
MSIGIVLGLGAVGTLAAWSDTATATSGTFTTGKLDIKVGNPAVDNNPTAFSTTLTNPAIFAGDTVAAGLLVSNAAGSVANTYTISVVASNTALGDLLDSSVRTGLPSGNSCGGTLIGSVSGLGTSKQFSAQGRLLPVNGSDQLCISVTMRAGQAQPTPAATGTVTYTITAMSS